MDVRSQEKRKRLEEALNHGVVMVHLDARRAGVVVPHRFRDDHHLRLNVSLLFDPPDLSIGDWGLRETLSFDKTPFKVGIPWQAVFAISTSARGNHAWLFPEDMPPELLEAAAERYGLTGEEVEQLKTEASEARTEELSPAKRMPFKVLEGGEPASDTPAAAPKPETKAEAEGAPTEKGESPEGPANTPGRRGHLRLVR